MPVSCGIYTEISEKDFVRKIKSGCERNHQETRWVLENSPLLFEIIEGAVKQYIQRQKEESNREDTRRGKLAWMLEMPAF